MSKEAIERVRSKSTHHEMEGARGTDCAVSKADLRTILSLLDEAREVLGPFAATAVAEGIEGFSTSASIDAEHLRRASAFLAKLEGE